MFQVIEDEDLVAILKDVSGESFHSEDQSQTQPRSTSGGHEYDCDKRLRHHKDNDPLDLDDTNSKNKNNRKYTTADVVTEAIQRIDPASSGGMISGNKKSGLINNSNFCDNNTTTTKCPSTNNIKSEVNNTSKKSQRQRHASSKKSRKNKQQMTNSNTGTGSSTTSGFSPPTIFPSNVPEMDLYLNSAASNVSPDSGIQSEGTVGANNSSPLHLHTGSNTSAGNGIPGSTGMNSEMTTLQTQSFQVTFETRVMQLINYTKFRQIMYINLIFFQFSPGTGTSSTIYQWPQNGYYQAASDWTTASATSTIYASGPTIPGAPLMAVVTPLPHHHAAQVDQDHVPTATILTSATAAAASATMQPLNRVVYAPTLEPASSDTTQGSSSTSCHKQLTCSLNNLNSKRGRGRPKGSKNKKKKMTMECGSQTVESSLESKVSSVSSSPSRYSLSDRGGHTPYHIDLDEDDSGMFF